MTSLEARRTRRVVYGATVVYALLFAAAAVVVYLSFHEQRLDLGDMVQAVWSTAHGHFLQVTTPSGREVTRLGLHADPFLALFAPLWWLWPSPLLLLVVQAAAVASGALPVYWLARQHLGSERAGAHFAFIYLLFPATQYHALTDKTGPHPVSFAVPLILFGIWFLYNDRLLPFAVMAVLAASTKEEIPIAVGCLGIWYAVRKGRRLVGATIFVLGAAATLVDVLVAHPALLAYRRESRSPDATPPSAALHEGSRTHSSRTRSRSCTRWRAGTNSSSSSCSSFRSSVSGRWSRYCSSARSLNSPSISSRRSRRRR